MCERDVSCSIITELMNQANGRYGPQPAPEEMIRDLPRVKMTRELVDSASIQDCSVCKDEFEVDDEASRCAQILPSVQN